MMSISGGLLIVGLLVFQGSVTSAIKLSSPCPGLFRYDSTDQPNQWTGTITLLSNDQLHGVWVRLLFGEKLAGLDVHDNFGEVVASEDHREFLIKNRDFLLKAGSPTNFKITVKYEGDKVPTLTGYRLNANMVCSEGEDAFGEMFAGDLNNKDFLTSITSQSEISSYKEFEGCGTTPLLDNEPANEKAEKGQWPWQGAIYIQEDGGEKYICGATLISSRHVLTSAHCVTYQASELSVSVSSLTVYLGKNDLDGKETDKNAQKLQVERIFLQPGYRAKQLLNDLAVIQLDKPVIIDDYVRPICLKQLTDKKEGFVLGYGIDGHKMEDLTQALVTVVSEEECLQKNSHLSALLSDNVVCTRYTQDEDQCVGDSGSSVVTFRLGPKPTWELKGIVTVGITLQDQFECNPSSRVFFVDITNYMKWIQAIAY